LRGVAALGVVLFHAMGATSHMEAPVGFIGWLIYPIALIVSYGYVGVFLFFVISGFCIHLQWAKAQASGAHVRIDFWSFWKRRWRRLYPPYLIALALYLLIAALTSEVRMTGFYLWDILLHLLMLHNFDPRTVYSINGVFWTLAVEEQLYLAYFILLFIRTRWGWTPTLLLCAMVRIGWFALCYNLKNSFGIEIPHAEGAAAYWLTWALGAMSVEAMVGLIRLPAWTHRLMIGISALLGAICLTISLPLFAAHTFTHHLLWLLLHPTWGVGFFIIINCAVRAEQSWRNDLRNAPHLVLWLAGIGLFSYSLYLTHQLVIMEAYVFYFTRLSPQLIALLIVLPVCLISAWSFFVFCEKPFLKSSAVAKKSIKIEEKMPAEHEALHPYAAYQNPSPIDVYE
jgi:peptidoglycan/LPS O-acetylase OafA/YrhL